MNRRLRNACFAKYPCTIWINQRGHTFAACRSQRYITRQNGRASTGGSKAPAFGFIHITQIMFQYHAFRNYLKYNKGKEGITLTNNKDAQIVLGLDIPKSVSQINSDIKKLQKQLKQIKATGALDTSAVVKAINAQITALQSQLQTITIQAAIDTEDAQKSGQKITEAVKTLTDSLHNFSAQNDGLSEFKTQINDAEVSLDSLLSKLSEANSTSDFSTILSQVNGLISDFALSKAGEAAAELAELDTLLTKIGRTANLTEQQLNELGGSAFETAGKYGKSAGDYLTGVQEMYRAGFKNAEEMAELSLLAQSAGDMEPDAANNYLMAANAAYNYKGNAEALNNVLDSQNYIADNAAVSLQDIANATSEAASIASQYGVTIDQLSALIAVAASQTRESGSEVGNALKSIFVSLQDTTSPPVVAALDSVGVSMTKIVDGSEQLKTPIELLKELSAAFQALPEGSTQRASLVTDIGTDSHADTLSAILGNWDSYESMLALYSQGMGSAAKEAEESANTIQGSLNRLHNTWTDTVGNIANSGAIKTIVNAFNGLLSIVNKATSALSSLGTAGLGAGIFAGMKNVGSPKMFGLNNVLNIPTVC